MCRQPLPSPLALEEYGTDGKALDASLVTKGTTLEANLSIEDDSFVAKESTDDSVTLSEQLDESNSSRNECSRSGNENRSSDHESTSLRNDADVDTGLMCCRCLEVGWIRRIQVLDTAYWEFLGVGTTFDIFQNIILIPYLEYGVLIPLDTTYWSLFLCGLCNMLQRFRLLKLYRVLNEKAG
ncbi:hypothetical protein Tco_0104672 [Tanacetum coccineum]